VLEETIATVESGRTLLPARARWLLDVDHSGRMLADWREIAQRELRGEGARFAPASRARRATELLDAIGRDRVPPLARAMAEATRRRKDADWARFREVQDHARASRRSARSTPATEMTFERFRAERWAPYERDVMARLLRRAGAPDADERADRIVADWRRFPYNRAHMAVHATLFWRHHVADRKVKAGDVYDAGLLVHMVGLDVLVSDDAAIHEMFPAVHDPPKRILSFADFIAEATRKAP
jgi:hypothetical protein